MTSPLQLSAQDRVLVLAPHPDDETLAAGDLIQSALAAGAALCVLFATDGDNNPWPQRWIEKRWRIGPRERARWGARRRQEALAALAQLGVPAPRHVATFLGWPDQGLTALLMRDDRAVEELAAAIAAFAPTHLAMPALRDRHPDHGALYVLAELALWRSGVECRRLAYLVHGTEEQESTRTLRLDVPDPGAKVRAMEAHASQLVLSRKRLLGIAARANRFELVEPVRLPAMRELQLPRLASRRRHALLLLATTAHGIERVHVAVPLAEGDVTVESSGGFRWRIRFAGTVRITWPDALVPEMVFAKLHRRDPRLLIFDEEPWRRDGELASGQAPVSEC